MVGTLLFYLAAFLLLLGVLVVVHEFGHFWVARRSGVKVLRFSVGFGQVLWRRRYGVDQTELTLCAIPLGGYVRMLDGRELEEGETIPEEDLPRAFDRQSVGRRSAIVAAGPLANLLLAILIYWLMFMVGGNALRPILGTPLEDTPAAAAGIRNGDRVLRVESEAVTTLEDFHLRLLRKASQSASVALEVADEQQLTRHVNLDTGGLNATGWKGDPFSLLGLKPYQPPFLPVLGEVLAGFPGEAAGLRPDDRVLAIDGVEVTRWQEFVDRVANSPEKPLSMFVERAGEQLTLVATPSREGKIGRLGVSPSAAEVAKVEARLPELYVFVRHNPVEAAYRAVREAWSQSALMLTMMGKMLAGEVSWRTLSGPVGIAEYAGRTARMGPGVYLRFMAIVSLCLGIFNLLPIPVLDGGHLMYHALEVVKGSPLSEKAMLRWQKVGISLLVTLMAFAFFNDLSRLLPPLFNG
ncbi:MAG: RIP metalloprotease RseP [Zoogloeaceae bacterium]|jgi:regulator of sigma E protease|nr:RIP metalloprotease RseP [Zoogloeaceae bacterium]